MDHPFTSYRRSVIVILSDTEPGVNQLSGRKRGGKENEESVMERGREEGVRKQGEERIQTGKGEYERNKG